MAVEHVPVFTEEQLGRYLAVTRKFAEILGAMALERLRETEASESVRETGEFSRQIIAGAEAGIVVYDLEMRIVQWNPFMERLSGVPASEVLGLAAPAVFPFLGEAGVVERSENAKGGGQAVDCSFAFLVGPNRMGSRHARIVAGAAGEIVGVVGMVQDITDRRRVEQALLEEQARRRRTQDTLAWAAGTDVREHTVWASREALRIYGLEQSGQTLPLETAQACVFAEDRGRLDEALRQLFADGRYDTEFRNGADRR